MSRFRPLKTASVHFIGADVSKQFASLGEAMEFAAAHVGNWVYAKPFPGEDQYLFGPGNGDTTITVMRDFELVTEREETGPKATDPAPILPSGK